MRDATARAPPGAEAKEAAAGGDRRASAADGCCGSVHAGTTHIPGGIDTDLRTRRLLTHACALCGAVPPPSLRSLSIWTRTAPCAAAPCSVSAAAVEEQQSTLGSPPPDAAALSLVAAAALRARMKPLRLRKALHLPRSAQPVMRPH
eukprot:122257-Prymnesium_polylepis.1